MASENPSVQRATLIALDQMPGGGLKPDQVLARLDSAEPVLRETANWLVSRHPEWGGALAGWFERQLAEVASGHASDELESMLVLHAGHPAIRDLLAATALKESNSIATRQLVLRASHGSREAGRVAGGVG
jgi:hypothetical protein